MTKAYLFAALLGATPTASYAHEVWVERDGDGPARIYLGEPAEPLPEGGDPEFAKLKAPKILSAPNVALRRSAGFIEVIAPVGDVRVWDDAVFAPWGKEGAKESVIYYARSGRSDPNTLLQVEFVPDAPGSNRFILIREAKPQPSVEVTIIDPLRASSKLTTDANGALTVPVGAKGRYLIAASIKDQGQFQTPGGDVAVLHHISTVSFVAP